MGKGFFESMLGDGTGAVSSKRFCGFISLLVFFGIEIAAVVYLWYYKKLETYLMGMIWANMTLIGAFFGLTLTEAPWRKD